MATESPTSRFTAEMLVTLEMFKDSQWEEPVPVSLFWNGIDYSIARNFPGNFTQAELAQLPIDQESTADQHSKLILLLRLLQEKLDQEEAATSPPGSLYTSNYQQWYRLWQGIYALQDELNLPEAEQTVRMLVDKTPYKSNPVPSHMLAEHLVKVGKYEEAEWTERPICAWMDARPHLGPSSPQALNARRLIAQAVWGQGPSRRSEAEALIAEIHWIVEEMGEGQFAVYQAEERRLNREMMATLR
ncbi:hypothetical protein AnigIFM59636_010120 [Aspergillus niger]|nr:hypothetical protein CBS11350_7968 [Aspergillus niger]KAI2958110.1 hypothetical protein CBS147323_8716 [Aspergillus niger]KAI3026230.1 hypothetical protein CBS147347_5075 [Aspergillus niger]KAI3063091.1 hypothetical protein CBS147353_9208 [Aspergillus niger]GKZ88983.1 hypothetical protein AnigIFM59636_010120 [Aspergillus niger]